MAIRTSIGTGDFGTAGTWDTGVPILGTDTAVIANTHNVTVSNAQGSGSKAGAIGIGITVQSGGTLTIGAAGILTVRGNDTTTNNALTVNANGNLVLNSGGQILVDNASEWSSTITCNGNLTSVGGIFDIPTTNFNWNNASGAHSFGPVSSAPWDKANSIYCIKINTTTVTDPGPISNSGGTGLGSFGNTSFAVASGGFSGTTSNEVSSYAGIALNGDYYMDYNKGFVYYKSATNTTTINFSFKYGTWFSYGILAQNNAANSAVSITGSTQINYAGISSANQTQENTQGGLMIDDKFASGAVGSSGRVLNINGLIFKHCTRPLQIYNTNTSATASTLANQLTIQNITFNHCHYQGFGVGNTPNFSNGLINHGYTNYVNHTNFVLNSFANVFSAPSRGPLNNITASNWTGGTSDGTGHIITKGFLPSTCTADGLCTSHGASITSPLIGFGGANDFGSINNDPCTFEVGGTAGHPNVYSNSFLRCAYRKARLTSYMTVTGNYCDRTYHHGTVHQQLDGYVSNYTYTNNTNTNCADSSLTVTTPSGGGWTSGYNRSMWIDNVTISHNTMDTANRGIQFNDFENSVTLVTRVKLINNIISGNQQGIRREPGDNTNQTSLALMQLDYNDDYNNTNVSNILQGTAMMSGSTYNDQIGKQCAGCYIFNPNYTLPSSSFNLVLTVAGTSGSTKSIKAAWGGGAQVEYVAFQGTLTAATNPAGGPPTLTDATLNNFTTTGAGLRAFQVMIVSGTGSGQYAMIKSNTSSVLTVIPNTASGAFAVAPDATSVYLIIKQDQTLTDTSTGTISCGMFTPELTTTNATYTDQTITFAKNYPGTSGANNGVNPSYTSATNFAPTNSSLLRAGSDGQTTGAIVAAASKQSQMVGKIITAGKTGMK